MNLKQIENIIAIAEEENISHAAAKLFISQSALSQSLLNLEKEIGLPLFKRVKKKMVLTYAGESYVESAKQIIEIKRRTYKLLSDISSNKKGRFSVGITSTRGLKLFSLIYPKFYQKYPEVIIDTKESGAKHLEEMIYEGDVDLGTVSTMTHIKEMEYELVDFEELYFIIPRSHPMAEDFLSRDQRSITLEELAHFKDDSFIATNKETALRSIFDNICSSAGITPNILFEPSTASSILDMVSGGIGVGIISYNKISSYDNVLFLSIKPKMMRNLWISYRKDNYITEPERYFISLIRDHYTNLRKKQSPMA